MVAGGGYADHADARPVGFAGAPTVPCPGIPVEAGAAGPKMVRPGLDPEPHSTVDLLLLIDRSDRMLEGTGESR